MENEQLILNTLSSEPKPMKAAEIAEKSGLDAKIVTKELGKMKKDGKVFCPKVCFYSPVN